MTILVMDNGTWKIVVNSIAESARRVHQVGEEHHRGARHVLRGGAARARAGGNGETTFSFNTGMCLSSFLTQFQIDNIAVNVGRAEADVEAGKGHLDKAKQHQSKARKMKIILAIVLTIVILIVILVVLDSIGLI